MSRARAIAVGCAVFLAAVATGAQQPPPAVPARQPPPPTFRSSVTIVPVDVRVLDRDGKPVTDLKQEEFVVTEDGTRQTITHFTAHRFEPIPALPGAKPALRARGTSEVKEQAGRVFLILFGRGRHQAVSNGVDAAIRLVRDRLLPQDQVAVLAWNRSTDFSNDRAKILSVLERYKKQHEGIEFKLQFQLSGLQAVYGDRGYPENVQRDIDGVFQGPGAITSRRVVPQPVPGAASMAEDNRRAVDAIQRGEVLANPDRPGTVGDGFDRAAAERQLFVGLDDFVSSRVQVSQDLQNLTTGIEYLRTLEGEKHLVFFTEQGMYLPRAEGADGIIEQANQARVVIDTIQTGGIDAGPIPVNGLGGPPVPSPAFTAMDVFRIRDLGMMSNLTGGQSAVRQYSSPAIDRIDAATRFGYLLGYRPTNTLIDNRYRRIVVRVTRPGLTVLYRHGYYSNDSPPPMDRRVYLTHQRIAGAGNYGKDVTDILVKVSASFVARGDKWSEVALDVSIDPAHVSFTTVEQRHVGQLDMAIYAADSKERVVGQSRHKIDMKLQEGTFQRYKTEGIPFKVAMTVAAKPSWVKVIVYDYAADLVGSTILKLK